MEFKGERKYIRQHDLMGDRRVSWILVNRKSESVAEVSCDLPFAIGPDPEEHHPTEHFAAECPLLDIGSQGVDRDDALAMMRKAVLAFIVSCLECQCLDSTLRELGFRVEEPEPITVNHRLEFFPFPVSEEEVLLDVSLAG